MGAPRSHWFSDVSEMFMELIRNFGQSPSNCAPNREVSFVTNLPVRKVLILIFQQLIADTHPILTEDK